VNFGAVLGGFVENFHLQIYGRINFHSCSLSVSFVQLTVTAQGPNSSAFAPKTPRESSSTNY